MRINNLIKISVYIAITTLFFSCMSYYKISQSPQNTSTPDVVIQHNLQRYFILRTDDTAFHMKNIIVNNDKKSISFIPEALPPEHTIHLTDGINGKLRYNSTNQPGKEVLNETHVYINPDPSLMPGNTCVLTNDKIQKIEVLEMDVNRTNSSHTIGAIVITGTIIGALLIAAVVLASNIGF